MTVPIQHIALPLKNIKYTPSLKPIDFDSIAGTYEITRKIAAQMIEKIDDEITRCIIDTAKEEGITDLYLIDKNFVISAIREKIEREKEKNI